MISTIITIFLVINIAALAAFTPLLLGLTILAIAILFRLLITTITLSWLPMTVFLIYIGGIIVIFAYFLAIQPNQFIPILFSFSAIIFSRGVIYLNYSWTYIASSISKNINITLIISNTNNSLTVLLVIILFYMLVVTIKITSPSYGPIRPFLKYASSSSHNMSFSPHNYYYYFLNI